MLLFVHSHPPRMSRVLSPHFTFPQENRNPCVQASVSTLQEPATCLSGQPSSLPQRKALRPSHAAGFPGGLLRKAASSRRLGPSFSSHRQLSTLYPFAQLSCVIVLCGVSLQSASRGMVSTIALQCPCQGHRPLPD